MFPVGYIASMKYELRTTSQYDKWFAGLKDSTGGIQGVSHDSEN
jgi:hypothetical protein